MASNHHDVNEAHCHDDDCDYANVSVFCALIVQVLFASMLDEEKSVGVGAAGGAGRRRKLRDDLVEREFAIGLADAVVGEELVNGSCL